MGQNKVSNLLLVLIVLLFASCKKETYNPDKFNHLLYEKPPVVVERYNVLRAKSDGTEWEVKGDAKVDSNTVIIRGKQGEQNFCISLTDFKTKTSFSVGPDSPDSAKYIKGNINYTSGFPNASGLVTITRLDSSKKLIEGTFSFVLVNRAGETTEIKEGYFKISYTENNMSAIVNNLSWPADTAWARIDSNNTVDGNDDKFVLTGRRREGNSIAEIRLVFPKDFSEGTHNLTSGGSYTAYFTYDISGTSYNCKNDVRNKITLSRNEATRSIRASFKFLSEDFDLIEQGKVVVSY